MACGTTLPDLQAIAADPSRYYGEFKKKKAGGGERTINPPLEPLKSAQSALHAHLREKLVWTRAVHGGISGRSPITNARVHVGKRVVACLDVADFFPSVGRLVLVEALRRAGCNDGAAELVADLSMFKGGLPQGASTSQILGNLVLEPVDSRYMAYCRKHGFIYTRFVDDLTVSGGDELRGHKAAFIGFIEKSGFKVKTSKVRFQGPGERQVVTGLVVNQRLYPTQEFVSDLMQTIRDCWRENFGLRQVADEHGLRPSELLRKLEGKIAHLRQFDRQRAQQAKSLMVRARQEARVHPPGGRPAPLLPLTPRLRP